MDRIQPLRIMAGHYSDVDVGKIFISPLVLHSLFPLLPHISVNRRRKTACFLGTLDVLDSERTVLFRSGLDAYT